MIAIIIFIISLIFLITGLSNMDLPMIVISILILFGSMIPLNKEYLKKRREKDE